MKFDFHITRTILKKDFLSLYPVLLLAACIFAGDVLITRLELMAAWSFLRLPLVLLGSTLVVLALFQLDAPASQVDDWLCRPVPRGELLTAKLVMVLAIVYGSRAAATLLADLLLGYGLREALLEALLLQDVYFQLFLPVLLVTAVITTTLTQGIGVVMALFVGVFVIPSAFISSPGALEPGIGDDLNVTGMAWIMLAPAKVLPLLLVALCFWLVYWRRHVVAGRAMLVGVTAVTLLLFVVPMWLLPWSTLYAWQAATLREQLRVDDEVVSRISLHASRYCFPATRIGDLTSDEAFSAARQAAGLAQWDEEVLGAIGPDTVTFLSEIQPVGLPPDWRVKLLYVEADLMVNGIEHYQLRPGRYITDNRGGGSLVHDWLLPETIVQQVSAAPRSSLQLSYDLALLKPASLMLKTDGVRRELAGLGTCSARINGLRNRIEIDCFSVGDRPGQISAELPGIPASRVYSEVDFAPTLVQLPRSQRLELTVASPRLTAQDAVVLTAWQPAAYLRKSLAFGGLLGRDATACPLPSAERQGPRRLSRWSDSAPHESLFLNVADGVQLEVLDFGGSGTPLLLVPGLGATAHAFDTLAPKLAERYRVFAMTRRGTGASSRVDFGYDTARLGEDIIAVLDGLALPRVVIAGHSVAGDELTWLGGHYPQRLHGLVYLDAAYDRTATTSARYRELNATLPPEPPVQLDQIVDYTGFKALQDSRGGPYMPEGELLAFYNVGRPYVAGSPNMDLRAAQAIQAALEVPDYAAVAVPALALYAMLGTELQLRPWQDPDDAALVATLSEMEAIRRGMQRNMVEQFRDKVPDARVVELHAADHWLFLTHEADVLRAIDDFIATLDVP